MTKEMTKGFWLGLITTPRGVAVLSLYVISAALVLWFGWQRSRKHDVRRRLSMQADLIALAFAPGAILGLEGGIIIGPPFLLSLVFGVIIVLLPKNPQGFMALLFLASVPTVPSFLVVRFVVYRLLLTRNQRSEDFGLLRQEFWSHFLERAQGRMACLAQASPTLGKQIRIAADWDGLFYGYVVDMEFVRLELYIDWQKVKENQRAFHALYARRERIEKAFGDHLEWKRLDHLQAGRIQYRIPDSRLSDQDRWLEIQDRMIEMMERMEQALSPEIEQIVASEG